MCGLPAAIGKIKMSELNTQKDADPNQHIKEYLDYYLQLSHPPHYAVLLTGPWGIGKTHLIRQILSTLGKAGDEYIYVSLYGLSSPAEIDEAIVSAIHPLIDHKGVRIAGRLAKSALKMFRVDIDIKPQEILNKFKGNLYVFDDLERCEMPVNKVLGYINEFVEHDNCKVVIIANESEISSAENYRKKKEKLIGKTLEVQSSLQNALRHFCTLIKFIPAKTCVEKNFGPLSTVYIESGLNNLRILQQAIWDFERVFKAIPGKYQINEGAMKVLAQLFFALSFEIKSGRLSEDDLRMRIGDFISSFSSDDSIKSPIHEARKRYTQFNLVDSILSDDLVVQILSKGIVDSCALSESLDRSQYFVSKVDEPAWRSVWFGIDKTDDEFNQSLNELEVQFAAREFVKIGEIFHVFGLRLWLSDIEMLKQDRSEIVQEGKQYVDDLYDRKKLETANKEEAFELSFNGYAGLAIRECNTPEYIELRQYLVEKQNQVEVESYAGKASALLDDLRNNPDLYFEKLCLTNSTENIYYNIPLLADIDPVEFVKTVLELSPEGQKIAFMTFKGRYDHGNLSRHLAKEQPWLAQVRDALVKAGEAKSALAQLRIKLNLQWNVDPFLDRGGDSAD